jgi:hypothetical protein
LRDSLAAILRFPILAYALPGAPALTAAQVITLSGWNNSIGVKQALVTTFDRHASYLWERMENVAFPGWRPTSPTNIEIKGIGQPIRCDKPLLSRRLVRKTHRMNRVADAKDQKLRHNALILLQ